MKAISMAKDVKLPKEQVKLPANNRLLDLFWDLAEGEDNVRITATEKMIALLKEKQKGDDEICKELEYATKRLIKGLASSRKLARLGFVTTLCQLLRTFPVITTSVILGKMKTELQVTSHEQKSDRSNIILGRVMGYLALIQAGTLFESPDDEVGKVVKLLAQARTKKVPIHQLCVQALCQVISKVSTSTFKTSVWAHIEVELTRGWDECSPDVLLLLLTVNNHHPSAVGKEFLSTHWNAKKIIAEKNFEHIKEVMKQSTVDHPLIHGVCPELVKRAMKTTEGFSSFWPKVVSDKLITQKMERRYLGYQLILVALQYATTTEQVTVTLTDTIVQSILTNLSHKDRPLYAPVKKLCEDLQTFVAGCTDSDIQLTMITSLVCHPGTVLFDALTNSKHIHNMVSKLTPEGCAKWTDVMMDLIRGKTETKYGDFSNQNYEDLVQFALTELNRSITTLALTKQTDHHLKLLKFLCLHGFFDVQKPVKDIPLCEPRVGQELPEKSRSNIQAAFFKAMDRMATYKAPGEHSAKDLRPYIDMLYQVTQFVQSLLSAGDKVRPYTELLPEALEEWQKVTQAVEEIRTKYIKDDKMGEGHAFELLFISLGLQLFSQPEDAMDIIKDLHVCYKKAFIKKRRMSMKTQSEPEWVEVVTEMLLSLLSQESHLVRVVTTTVFRMLSPHMTSAGLKLVLNVLQPEDEEGPLEFEEDDEEDEEEDEGSKDSGMEEDEEQEDESEESSDEEEEEPEEDVQVDEGLKQSLKKALGKAAVDTDEEDDDAASDLDDEAMFKLDGALAMVFKGMLKNKKNSKEEKEKTLQLKNFKIKCLDLLNAFVTSDPPPSLSLELLFPLLELMDKGAQDRAMSEVGRKATSVFKNLIMPKKVLTDPQLDKETLPDLIQKLVDFSVRAHGVPLVISVSSACLFVIRIMLGIESNSGPSPVRTRSRAVMNTTPKAKNKTNGSYDIVQSIITESLHNFCLKRDTHLNHMLFHSMFERQPSILWPQADVLLQFIQNEDVRVFCRTQVCGMLAVMMKKETMEGIGEEAWQDFGDKVIQILPEMIVKKIQLSDIKPRFVYELLYLTLRVCSTSQHVARQLLTPEVIEKVKALQQNVKKDTKNVCRKIVNLTTTSGKRQKSAGGLDGGSPSKKAKISDGQENRVDMTPGSAKQKGKPEVNEVSDETEDVQTEKCESNQQELTEEQDSQEILEKTPRKNLNQELLNEESMSSKKKKKKRKSINNAENESFTSLKTPETSSIIEETNSGKKTKGKGVAECESPGVYSVEKFDLGEETKSGKKKKRKSLCTLEEDVNTTLPTLTESLLQNGTEIMSSESLSTKKSAKKTKKTETLSSEDTKEITPSPKRKVNRRRSMRLSLMGTPKGTPKAE